MPHRSNSRITLLSCWPLQQSCLHSLATPLYKSVGKPDANNCWVPLSHSLCDIYNNNNNSNDIIKTGKTNWGTGCTREHQQYQDAFTCSQSIFLTSVQSANLIFYGFMGGEEKWEEPEWLAESFEFYNHLLSLFASFHQIHGKSLPAHENKLEDACSGA